MNKPSDDLFYTKEHEWIRFTAETALIGIAQFKLTGIPKIDNIGLFGFKVGDLIPQDSILLNLHYREYTIPVHAPVACKLLEINNIVENGSWEMITDQPEGKGWLFKVAMQQQYKSHLVHNSLYRERFPLGSIVKS
ncbi:MAG: hypothetical protein WC756_21050 [Taibaiella sp.]|jgi:glycine cleavage system H lipoate-binding protein